MYSQESRDKYRDPISHEKHCVFLIQIDRLIRFKEIKALYSEIQTLKYTCGPNS
jgi:hypothetical protein